MKPAIAKGTRDFLPSQVYKRKYIFNTIQTVFEKYGYAPIETPTMELLSTLTGKYGEEGDQLLFKVLNNGDYLKKANVAALEQKDSKNLVASIAKRGLRYDLTIPFARFVVMHQNDIAFPFKRYQIQPVWRADRPQKGRYQEFYQCDVDVVGSNSLVYESELVQIYDEVFGKLNVQSTIKINNRKVLFGIAEVAGIKDHFIDFTVAIDKLDKVGMDGVVLELQKRNINKVAIDKIIDILGSPSLNSISLALTGSDIGMEGISEIKTVFNYLEDYKNTNSIVFDVTLARGLSYYTGCIFEVASNEVSIGSIGGGGRYNDLTSSFGLKNVPGVGVSFGAARIYDVMEELNLFPDNISKEVKILFLSFDQAGVEFSFKQVSTLRAQNISADIYPEAAKFKKQMKYADQRGIPYVAIIGDQELETGMITVKEMKTGEQYSWSMEELISRLNNI